MNITTLPKTMSSREIADLTEKRHDNVLRVIESLAGDGLILPQLEEVPNPGPGPKQICQYLLGDPAGENHRSIGGLN